MSDWKIREAKPEDAPVLADCIEAAYSIYAGKVADLPPMSEGIADDIENNIVWVAERDEQIVGGMVLTSKPDHIVLANVAVSPDATGAGLGSAFMRLAEAESRRLHVNEIKLNTHVDMPKNVRLYEHLGWHETGRSGNKVHMSKSIPS